MSAVRDVKVQYGGPSALQSGDGRAQVTLSLDGSRGTVGVRGFYVRA